MPRPPRACHHDVRAWEGGMSGTGTGPLSIGMVWGIDCTAKYWRNTWHLFCVRRAATRPRPTADLTGIVRTLQKCFLVTA
eukprot:7336118-Prymnesium_polylepis.1